MVTLNDQVITSNINDLSIELNTKKNHIKSYGISCFTKIKDDLKVLLIKRKYTYEFFHFITCNYVFNKNNLIKMFNKMTVDEKRLILYFDFDILWCKLWYEINSFNNIIYHKTKKIYDEYINIHKDMIINELKNSENLKDCDCDLWSLPKGRKNYSTENKFLVAIREFFEETGISRNNYYFNFNFKRHFILDNKYKINYYIAVYKNNKKVSLDLTNVNLLNEVNGIAWFSLDEIKNECNYLYKHIKPAFIYIKNNDLIL
jgi:ADP-ribose pyrophosphatase YjhB (NUDIX family)